MRSLLMLLLSRSTDLFCLGTGTYSEAKPSVLVGRELVEGTDTSGPALETTGTSDLTTADGEVAMSVSFEEHGDRDRLHPLVSEDENFEYGDPEPFSMRQHFVPGAEQGTVTISGSASRVPDAGSGRSGSRMSFAHTLLEAEISPGPPGGADDVEARRSAASSFLDLSSSPYPQGARQLRAGAFVPPPSSGQWAAAEQAFLDGGQGRHRSTPMRRARTAGRAGRARTATGTVRDSETVRSNQLYPPAPSSGRSRSHEPSTERRVHGYYDYISQQPAAAYTADRSLPPQAPYSYTGRGIASAPAPPTPSIRQRPGGVKVNEALEELPHYDLLLQRRNDSSETSDAMDDYVNEELEQVNADLHDVKAQKRELLAKELELEAKVLTLDKKKADLDQDEDTLLVQRARLLREEGVLDAGNSSGGDSEEGGPRREDGGTNMMVMLGVLVLVMLFAICMVMDGHGGGEGGGNQLGGGDAGADGTSPPRVENFGPRGPISPGNGRGQAAFQGEGNRVGGRAGGSRSGGSEYGNLSTRGRGGGRHASETDIGDAEDNFSDTRHDADSS
mmetsp:Transcript_24701/g.62077  ORF Transcript_24701/g.62077 Transcript_24701/m.62077 type:complete len:560 (+) Transcript_24701:89-1768(+)